jgi:hypothetical protein
MSGIATIMLPETLRFRPNRGRPTAILPTSLMVRSEPSLHGEALRISGRPTRTGAAFSLALRTDFSNKLFSYFMVLAPLGLVALALIVMARAAPDGDWQSVLALSLGLFAIIPIRQVAVPADIGAVTRLDKMLALDVISVIAVGLFIAAHVVSRQRQMPHSHMM